jgi:hypothetical protein
MSTAVFSSAAKICDGVAFGERSSISAATAAASGAAALVPKKFGRVSVSWVMSLPKNVVLPPSVAVKRGWLRVIVVVKR